MSKPVKNLVTEAYKKTFAKEGGAVVLALSGLKGTANTKLRNALSKDGYKLSIVKNSLARRALKGTKLEILGDALSGPNALAFGGEGVVSLTRKLLEVTKGNENVTIKGAAMDGLFFGPKDIVALSKYPTRGEALSQLSGLVLSPASALAGAIVGAGAMVASLIKAVEEKLEKAGPATPAEAPAAPPAPAPAA